MTDPVTQVYNVAQAVAPERVMLFVRDEKLAVAVLGVGFMLTCAIWGAANIIASAIREKRP